MADDPESFNRPSRPVYSCAIARLTRCCIVERRLHRGRSLHVAPARQSEACQSRYGIGSPGEPEASFLLLKEVLGHEIQTT